MEKQLDWLIRLFSVTGLVQHSTDLNKNKWTSVYFTGEGYFDGKNNQIDSFDYLASQVLYNTLLISTKTSERQFTLPVRDILMKKQLDWLIRLFSVTGLVQHSTDLNKNKWTSVYFTGEGYFDGKTIKLTPLTI